MNMKKSYLIIALLGLGLPLFSSATQVPATVVEANVSASSFNSQVFGVKFRMVETHLNDASYYVSTDHQLYGKGITDIDTGANPTLDPSIKYSNYLYRIHDYIDLLDGELVQDIELSQNGRFIITQSGKVLAAGYNGSGALGNGTTTDLQKPTDVTSSFGDLQGDKVVKITTNGAATYALTNGGKVFAYGNNFYIGNNTAITFSAVTTPIDITSFFESYDPLNDKIVDLQFGLALTENGTVYSWGNWGTPFSPNLVPTIVFASDDIPNAAENEKVISMVATGKGAMLLTSAGRLFGIGSNDFIQLGLSDYQIVYQTFTELDLSTFSFLTETNYIQFLTNGFAITTDGNVIAWGTNKFGTAGLGVNNTLENYVPFTNVTTSVTKNLRDGEYFVSAFKSGNTNDGAASTLISNLGIVYGLGGRYTLGFPNDGNNTPIREPIAVAPDKVTFTVDPLDGPEVGSFIWPYGYGVPFNDIIYFSNPAILNIVRPGYQFGGLFFDNALTQNVVELFGYVATEDITLYPKWTAISYTLYYQAPGVVMTHDNPSQLTGILLPYTLKPATAQGRTFLGWFKDIQLTQAISEITFSDFTNNQLFLYAKFELGGGASSSTPSSSEGGDPDTGPRSVLLPAILITTAVGGLGAFSWFFFFKNLSIGGFSFVALKKWWAALGKRDKKDKDKE